MRLCELERADRRGSVGGGAPAAAGRQGGLGWNSARGAGSRSRGTECAVAGCTLLAFVNFTSRSGSVCPSSSSALSSNSCFGGGRGRGQQSVRFHARTRASQPGRARERRTGMGAGCFDAAPPAPACLHARLACRLAKPYRGLVDKQLDALGGLLRTRGGGELTGRVGGGGGGGGEHPREARSRLAQDCTQHARAGQQHPTWSALLVDLTSRPLSLQAVLKVMWMLRRE